MLSASPTNQQPTLRSEGKETNIQRRPGCSRRSSRTPKSIWMPPMKSWRRVSRTTRTRSPSLKPRAANATRRWRRSSPAQSAFSTRFTRSCWTLRDLLTTSLEHSWPPWILRKRRGMSMRRRQVLTLQMTNQQLSLSLTSKSSGSFLRYVFADFFWHRNFSAYGHVRIVILYADKIEFD